MLLLFAVLIAIRTESVMCHILLIFMCYSTHYTSEKPVRANHQNQTTSSDANSSCSNLPRFPYVHLPYSKIRILNLKILSMLYPDFFHELVFDFEWCSRIAFMRQKERVLYPSCCGLMCYMRIRHLKYSCTITYNIEILSFKFLMSLSACPFPCE